MGKEGWLEETWISGYLNTMLLKKVDGWSVLDACLEGQKMTLDNIYAHNFPKPEFFHEVCNIVRHIGNTNIIGGVSTRLGMCFWINLPNLGKLIHCSTCAAMDVMSEELGLVDIWRLLHPQERNYTLFSHPHSTYSRIDSFLVSCSSVDQTIGSSIGNRAVTDHALVEFIQRRKSKTFTQVASQHIITE